MQRFALSTPLQQIIASAGEHRFPGIMHESCLQQSLGTLKKRIEAMEIVPCGKLHETADGRDRPTYSACPLRERNGVCGHPSFVISHIRTALWICMAHGIIPMKVEPYDSTALEQETYTVLDTTAKRLDAELTDLDENAARNFQHTVMRHLQDPAMQRSQTNMMISRIQEQERTIGESDFLPLKSTTLRHLGMLILR